MLLRHDTIITNKTMKTTHIFGITFIFIALILALVITHFNQPSASALNADTAPISFQVTATPLADDASVIGSTDGILIMGIVIVLIVIVPLLLYKKK